MQTSIWNLKVKESTEDLYIDEGKRAEVETWKVVLLKGYTHIYIYTFFRW